MSKSLNCLYYHVVWSTHVRRPLIEPDMDRTIARLASEQAKIMSVEILACGNTDDHLHLLIKIPAGQLITHVVGRIKGFISHRIKDIFTESALYWQRGYSAFTVSEQAIKILIKYIKNQRNKEVRP